MPVALSNGVQKIFSLGQDFQWCFDAQRNSRCCDTLLVLDSCICFSVMELIRAMILLATFGDIMRTEQLPEYSTKMIKPRVKSEARKPV